jgi:hypothetical protein
MVTVALYCHQVVTDSATQTNYTSKL